jgi:SAM-dependent methyltransferase
MTSAGRDLRAEAAGAAAIPRGDTVPDAYADIARFYDRLAVEHDEARDDRWLRRVRRYRDLVNGLYRELIPRGHRVLEVGCGRGDLLAGLEPDRGVGVDVSEGMIAAARAHHPGLEFAVCAGEGLALEERFDYIVLSDLVPFVDDLQALFESVARHSHTKTRVVLNTFSNAWRPALAILRVLRLRPDHPIRNWVAPNDLENLLALAGLELVTERREILVPVRPGALSRLVNGVIARMPGIRSLTMTFWMIARPAPRAAAEQRVSVLVPCRNEAGSIDSIVDRVPEVGAGTEIVFVEGHSSDDTRARIEQAIAKRPDRDLKLVVQTGNGKGNAVREGFAAASGDVYMILDGDLTVAPEDLPKFYAALISGSGEVINGTRLIYGMEHGAMRFLNMLGNKFFASVLTLILGQYVKDTLCGTKALYRADYERILAHRTQFGAEDPFGDFDLLLGAAVLGLRILNIPVRYRARSYGRTNIHRFSDGGMLFRLAAGGYKRMWLLPYSSAGDRGQR